MDGEQLCFSLGVYKDKYFKDHEKALAKVLKILVMLNIYQSHIFSQSSELSQERF